MRETLLDPGLQRVVIRKARRAEPANEAVKLGQRASGRERQIRVGIRFSLVAIQIDVLLQAMRSRIGDFEHRVRGQLVLRRQVPLLHVGCHQLGIERKEKRRRLGIGKRICREAAGECGYAGQGTVHGRRIGRRRTAGLVESFADEERRIESHARIRVWPGLVAAVKDPVTGAHDKLLAHLVRQADAGSEIVGVGRNQSWSGSGLHRNDRGQLRSKLRGHALGHDQGPG